MHSNTTAEIFDHWFIEMGFPHHGAIECAAQALGKKNRRTIERYISGDSEPGKEVFLAMSALLEGLPAYTGNTYNGVLDIVLDHYGRVSRHQMSKGDNIKFTSKDEFGRCLIYTATIVQLRPGYGIARVDAINSNQNAWQDKNHVGKYCVVNPNHISVGRDMNGNVYGGKSMHASLTSKSFL
jgi:hypothetical protein